MQKQKPSTVYLGGISQGKWLNPCLLIFPCPNILWWDSSPFIAAFILFFQSRLRILPLKRRYSFRVARDPTTIRKELVLSDRRGKFPKTRYHRRRLSSDQTAAKSLGDFKEYECYGAM